MAVVRAQGHGDGWWAKAEGGKSLPIYRRAKCIALKYGTESCRLQGELRFKWDVESGGPSKEWALNPTADLWL